MPSSPVFDLAFKQTGKRLHQARDGKRGSGSHTGAEAKAQNRLPGQCTDQGDIARARACVLPSERAIAVKILPTVAFADVARAGYVECVVLSFVDGCKRKTERALLGRKHALPTPVNSLLQQEAAAVARAGGRPGAMRPGELLNRLAT